jgi:hypothetical protein
MDLSERRNMSNHDLVWAPIAPALSGFDMGFLGVRIMRWDRRRRGT